LDRATPELRQLASSGIERLPPGAAA
jgi:hypothetical protein